MTNSDITNYFVFKEVTAGSIHTSIMHKQILCTRVFINSHQANYGCKETFSTTLITIGKNQTGISHYCLASIDRNLMLLH